MTADQMKLVDAMREARRSNSTVKIEIAGNTFEVSFHIVNRKCYDFEPTPTVQYKVNGKRIGGVKAYGLLA